MCRGIRKGLNGVESRGDGVVVVVVVLFVPTTAEMWIGCLL